jgi:uncharacterized protein (UPF0147 family)
VSNSPQDNISEIKKIFAIYRRKVFLRAFIVAITIIISSALCYDLINSLTKSNLISIIVTFFTIVATSYLFELHLIIKNLKIQNDVNSLEEKLNSDLRLTTVLLNNEIPDEDPRIKYVQAQLVDIVKSNNIKAFSVEYKKSAFIFAGVIIAIFIAQKFIFSSESIDLLSLDTATNLNPEIKILQQISQDKEVPSEIRKAVESVIKTVEMSDYQQTGELNSASMDAVEDARNKIEQYQEKLQNSQATNQKPTATPTASPTATISKDSKSGSKDDKKESKQDNQQEKENDKNKEGQDNSKEKDSNQQSQSNSDQKQDSGQGKSEKNESKQGSNNSNSQQQQESNQSSSNQQDKQDNQSQQDSNQQKSSDSKNKNDQQNNQNQNQSPSDSKESNSQQSNPSQDNQKQNDGQKDQPGSDSNPNQNQSGDKQGISQKLTEAKKSLDQLKNKNDKNKPSDDSKSNKETNPNDKSDSKNKNSKSSDQSGTGQSKNNQNQLSLTGESDKDGPNDFSPKKIEEKKLGNPDEKTDSRFTGSDSKISENKDPAKLKTELGQFDKLTQQQINDARADKIPLEYKEYLSR